jgi:hypothetical protein
MKRIGEKSIPSVGFETTIPGNKAAADCTATEIGSELTYCLLLSIVVKQFKKNSSRTA